MIFAMEFVAALGHALRSHDSNVRGSAIEMLQIAIAEGPLSSVCRVSILKHL